jgi:RHS repeat-associated protein
MGNPLVADVKSSTEAYTGISLMESAVDLKSAIESGDWASVAMGSVGTALDALSMAMDPFGAALAAGVGWLIEHVGPLKEALDALAGNPDAIRANSETWANVAKELGSVGEDLTSMVNNDLVSWTGVAADAYRQRASDTVALMGSAKEGSEGASSGVKTAGEVVAAVRSLVRDIIAELIGHMISWALQVVFTLGIGLTWVVPQVVAAVAKTASQIASITNKLVKALKSLIPLLKKAGDLFADAAKALKNVKGGKAAPTRSIDDLPGSPKGPDAPGGGKGGGGDTTPSSAPPPPKGGDGSTTPSGAGGGGNGSPNAGSGDTPPPKGGDTGPDGSTTPSGSGAGSGGSGGGKGSGGGNGGIKGENTNPPHNSTPTKDLPNCGDPVDVATGRMFMTQVDVELLASMPLMVSRTHLSDYRSGRSFGRTWASTVDQRLEVDEDGIRFAAEDGALLTYPTPGATGEVLPEHGPRWPLTRLAEGGFAIKVPESAQTLYFAATGGRELPITAAVRAVGGRIEFERDAAGTLTAIDHSGGYRVGVETDNGLITAFRLLKAGDQDGLLLVRYRYDDARRLVEVLNSSGLPLQFGYDAEGRVTSWHDRNGVSYRYGYDATGRCVRMDGDGGFLSYTMEYDQTERITKATDSLGNTVTYHFNELLQLVREVDPQGNETRNEWDRHHRLIVETDALGRSTRYRYDDAGDLREVTRPDGLAERFEYDSAHRAVVIVDAGGAVTRREYGSRGEVAATVDPAGARTTFGYDVEGNLASVTDPLGNVTTIVNDSRGLVVSVIDPIGARTQYEYDVFGRVSMATNPVGEVSRFAWTIEGLPLRTMAPDGSVEQWTYDAEGNLREHRDAAGARTITEVDHFDLPIARVGPDGGRMEFGYDTELRLVSVRNQQGRFWRYRYDASGNLVEETDFDGRVLAYGYDAAGQLVHRTNGVGETMEFTRDALGRVVEQRMGDAVMTVSYDAAGRVLKAVNPDSELSYTFDAQGRVLTETCNGRTVTSQYDLLGRRVRRTLPSGAQSDWTFDAVGAPIGVRVGTHTMTLRRDLVGREVQRSWGALDIRQHWDSAGRLGAQTVSSAAGMLQRRAYDYRADGLLTGTHDALAGSRTFELDPVGRITAVTGPSWAERYGYDATGNVVSAQLSSAAAGDPLAGERAYNGTLLKQAGATGYTHDGQGRLVERVSPGPGGVAQRWRFEWNAEDKLVAAVTPDGQRWHYRYDPMGRRIAKQRLGADGVVVEQIDFTWDGTDLAEEHQLTAGGDRRMLSWEVEPGSELPLIQSERLIGKNSPQQVVDQRFYSIVTDLVGTPTELVGLDGTVNRQSARTIWGQSADGAGASSTPLRFPGQYYDAETGLHYNYHRYFDPGVARYISADPLGLGGGANPQAYVSNPTAMIDPLGLTPVTPCGKPTGGGNNGGGRGNGGGGNGSGGGGRGPRRPPWLDTPGTTTPNATVPHTETNPNGMLYHYTDAGGMNGISQSGNVRPSIWQPGNPNNAHARFGSGGYFTDIAPGSLSQQDLSQALVLNPFTGNRFTHYIEVDPHTLESSGYTVSQSPDRPNVYVVHHDNQPTNFPNPSNVEIGSNGSMTGFGPNPNGPHLGSSMAPEDPPGPSNGPGRRR